MSDKKTIWITGSKGFIGGELTRRLGDYGYRVVGTDTELSVAEPSRLEAFAIELQPDVIINSAGISRNATGINNRLKAYEVNAMGAMNVAVVANTVGAHMIQISTDDVYPQRMSEPANEFDTPRPETPYGKSKRAGEVMVRDSKPDSLIVRSSWVYSVNGGLIKEAFDCIKQDKPFKAYTDQYASPTSILTYTNFLVKAIEKKATGVLHIASRGTASRYEFLSKVMATCGYEPNQVLTPETDVVKAEQVLLESLMLEMFGAELPTWEEDVENYFKELKMAK
ncbi:MAG: NAD(P)-dependent oxidoreductase [Eggerthellaceae bacterium]